MAITAIAANGWQATYSGTPGATRLDEAVVVTQPGYDDTGAAATDTRTLLVTNRIRNPGLTTYTSNTVGVSLRVIANSTSSGVSISSSAVSPFPIMTWASEFRQVIGAGARTVEAFGAQYFFKLDGRPLACVIFSASDGTTTVYQTAKTIVISGETTDMMPVYVYRATFTGTQMASLAEGLITYNARAIPWVGDNTQSTDLLRSIANTADWSARGFVETAGWSPRYDVKDLTRFATQPRCYVDPVSGSNTTGIWGTAAQDGAGGAADPSLFPFANVSGALVTVAARGPAAGSSTYLGSTLLFDGGQIRVRAATHIIGVAGAGVRTVKCAAVIVTRDPAVAKSSAIIDIGNAAGTRMRLAGYSGVPGSALVFRDVSLTRSGATTIQTETGQVLTLTFENSGFDNNNVTGVVATAGVTSVRYHGTSPTNLTTSIMTQCAYFRGGTMGGTAINVNSPTVLGARIPDMRALFLPDNAVYMGVFGTVLSNVTSAVITLGNTTNPSNILRAACIFEMAQAGTATAMDRISGDADTGSCNNHLMIQCTMPGFSDNGRRNAYYVDNDIPTASRDRTQQFIREENNIWCQDNSKHDLFAGGPVDALRIGGWERLYGVGHNSNFTMYLNAGSSSTPGTSFGPEYDGPQSLLGTSISVKNDPKFVAPAHASASGVAGAGGGDYTLQSSSPARTMTAGPTLPGFGNAAGAIAPSGITLAPDGVTFALSAAAAAITGSARMIGDSATFALASSVANVKAAAAVAPAAVTFGLVLSQAALSASPSITLAPAAIVFGMIAASPVVLAQAGLASVGVTFGMAIAATLQAAGSLYPAPVALSLGLGSAALAVGAAQGGDLYPITLTEAKRYLRVDSDDEDDLIEALVSTAAGQIKAMTGVVTRARDFTAVFPGFSGPLVLNRRPVNSIGAVTYLDGLGATQTLAVDQYTLSEFAGEPVLVLATGAAWPMTAWSPGSVSVTYNAGYASNDLVPAQLRTAARMMVAGWFTNRDGGDTISPMAMNLLQPFRVRLIA